MHKFVKNICKPGMLMALPVFVLSACSGKEAVLLELNEPETVQAADAQPGLEKAAGQQPETVQAKLASSEAVQTAEAQQAALNESGDFSATSAISDAEPSEIYVHICGAVVKPGVYELEKGSRIFEGIEAAGGFREDACEDYVNQAGQLADGQRLVIPTKEEIEAAKEDGSCPELWKAEAAGAGISGSAGAGMPGAAGTGISGAADAGVSGTGGASGSGGLVNINTATESELGAISGIGAGKAAAIVQYRQENGSFASIEDIMKVSGIKEGTYEKIKDKITVN